MSFRTSNGFVRICGCWPGCTSILRIQGKLDASDLVQQTLLEAHCDLPSFRGRTEGELAAWLRAILAHQLCALAPAGPAPRTSRHPVRAFTGAGVGRIVGCLARLGRPATPPHPANSPSATRKRCGCRRPWSSCPSCSARPSSSITGKAGRCQRLVSTWSRTQPAVAGLVQRGLRELRRILNAES